MGFKSFALSAAILIGCITLPARAADAPVAAAPAAKPAGITLVNIHMKQALPEDVFNELGKQGGIKFTPNGDPNMWDQDALQTPMDIDFTDRPFWSAVREACKLWNLSPQTNFNSARRIQLSLQSGNRSWDLAPTCESNGFLIQATTFNRQQSVQYNMPSPGNVQNFCSVQMTVYADPALRITTFNQSAKVDEAVDDAGHSMVPDNSNRNFYGGGMNQRSLIYNCTVQLKYPDNPGKKIAHLKCSLQMRGGDKLDTLAVDKPLEAGESSKTFGDITITFESLKKNGGNYELKVGIADDNDQGNPGDVWGLIQKGQLLDDKGRAFNFAGGGGGGNGPNGAMEYTANYSPNNGGDGNARSEPVKWLIELPTETKSIKIPVEFKDLALP